MANYITGRKRTVSRSTTYSAQYTFVYTRYQSYAEYFAEKPFAYWWADGGSDFFGIGAPSQPGRVGFLTFWTNQTYYSPPRYSYVKELSSVTWTCGFAYPLNTGSYPAVTSPDDPHFVQLASRTISFDLQPEFRDANGNHDSAAAEAWLYAPERYGSVRFSLSGSAVYTVEKTEIFDGVGGFTEWVAPGDLDSRVVTIQGRLVGPQSSEKQSDPVRNAQWEPYAFYQNGGTLVGFSSNNWGGDYPNSVYDSKPALRFAQGADVQAIPSWTGPGTENPPNLSVTATIGAGSISMGRLVVSPPSDSNGVARGLSLSGDWNCPMMRTHMKASAQLRRMDGTAAVRPHQIGVTNHIVNNRLVPMPVGGFGSGEFALSGPNQTGVFSHTFAPQASSRVFLNEHPLDASNPATDRELPGADALPLYMANHSVLAAYAFTGEEWQAVKPGNENPTNPVNEFGRLLISQGPDKYFFRSHYREPYPVFGLSQAQEVIIAGAPFASDNTITVGNWHESGNARIVGQGSTLRFQVETAPNGLIALAQGEVNQYTLPCVFSYRFITVRIRSTGGANQKFYFGTSPQIVGIGTPDSAWKTTGADGEWVEVEFDLCFPGRRRILLGASGNSSTGDQSASRTSICFPGDTALDVVYELEWIKGRRKYETLVSVLADYASAGVNRFDQRTLGLAGNGIEVLHAFTDGILSLSLPNYFINPNYPNPGYKLLRLEHFVRMGANDPNIDPFADDITPPGISLLRQEYLMNQGWTLRDLCPMSASKRANPYGFFAMSELFDSNGAATWLHGAGLLGSTFTPFLDQRTTSGSGTGLINVDNVGIQQVATQPIAVGGELTLKAQVTVGQWGPFYLGAGDAVGGGSYGAEIPVQFHAIEGGQFVGQVLLEQNDVTVTSQPDNSVVGTARPGAPSTTSGYYATSAPFAPARVASKIHFSGDYVNVSRERVTTDDGLGRVYAADASGALALGDPKLENYVSDSETVQSGTWVELPVNWGAREYVRFYHLRRLGGSPIAIDSARQWLHRANGKKLQTYRLVTVGLAFESAEHPVDNWKSLVWDERRGAALFALGTVALGVSGNRESIIYRSGDGGRTIAEILRMQADTGALEKDSERGLLIFIFADTQNAVSRRLSRNGGVSWEAAAPVLLAGTALTGRVMDLAQDARSAGVLLLSLQDASGSTAGNVRVLKSTDCGLNWTVLLP